MSSLSSVPQTITPATTLPTNNTSNPIYKFYNPILLSKYNNLSKNTTLSSYLNNTATNINPTATQSTNLAAGSTNIGNILTTDGNKPVEIGLVPYMTGTTVGAGLTNASQALTEQDIIKLGLINIDMIPMEINFVGTSFMLYNLSPATTSDAPPRLKIYTYPNEIAIEESFGNQLQSSFFESLVKPIEPLGQLAQLKVPGIELLGNLIYKGISGTLGGFADVAGKLSSTLHNDIMGAQGTLGESISTYLQGSRIMWPKIWADSNMVINYTIPIYLFCNNTASDDDFTNSVINPLKYLLQYTLPRSTGGGTYNWPWMVYSVAPGLFVLPEGIVSNITIDKYDIGFNNRPATVKVTLTLTTLREVMPQDGVSKGVNNIPTVALNLNTYLANLGLSKGSTNIPIYQSSTPIASTSMPLSSNISNISSPSIRNLNTSLLNKYDTQIQNAANKYNVPSKLIKCVMAQENQQGNPILTSPKGAIGLMQVLPPTAKSQGIDPNNLYKIQDNIDAGTSYLSKLLKQYNGNTTLALAAYNAGPGAVSKYNGVPPYTETINYVASVGNCYNSTT